jgi:hypothetical protein
MNLETIKKYFQDISGKWNGDEEGLEAENAQVAEEILNLIEELN